MSETKMMATTLWTKLVVAMRQDGLIAHCVMQSGPATTAVLVEAVTAPEVQAALPLSILPEKNRQVVAWDEKGRMTILIYTNDKGWIYDHSYEKCDPVDWHCWTYLKLPE
jgi:hypothetical protein